LYFHFLLNHLSIFIKYLINLNLLWSFQFIIFQFITAKIIKFAIFIAIVRTIIIFIIAILVVVVIIIIFIINIIIVIIIVVTAVIIINLK